MKKLLSTVAATVATISLAFAGALALATPSNAVDARDNNATRVDDFRACIAGGGVTDMMLLIDESSSLLTTDPKAARVSAADYLVKQLSGFTEGSKSKVNVAVSAFSNEYRSIKGWTELSPKTLPELQTSIDSFKSLTNGMETDYWTALDGARKELAARAAARTETRSCQVVIWFTDGALNIMPRTSADALKKFGEVKSYAPDLKLDNKANATKATAAAREDLCRAGGVADQLRSSEVAMFAIGLGGTDSKDSEFDFMKSVATGTDSKNKCGDLVDPVPGEFHLAKDIDSLLLAFDGISSTGSSPIIQNGGICQVNFCEDKAHRVVLDDTTPQVSVLATADADGIIATMVNPAGQKIELPRKALNKEESLKDGENTIKYTWLSDKTVSISMAAAGAKKGWAGLWQIAFTDPKGASKDKASKSSIHISGNLAPAWLNPKDAPLNANAVIDKLKFALKDDAGQQVKASSLLGTAKLSISVVGSDGKAVTVAQDLDKNSIESPQKVDLKNVPVGAGQLKMTLNITTAGTTYKGQAVKGTNLEPVNVSVPVSILATANFPKLGSKIVFNAKDGQLKLDGELTANGQGCVWLPQDKEPKVVAAPKDIGKSSIVMGSAKAFENCLPVKDGSKLPVTYSAEKLGTGTVNGTVTVMIAPTGDAAKAMAVQVPFTATLSKPLNTMNFILALIVALILGPGIPLLLLYLAKWWVAKIPGKSLSAEFIPVRIVNGQVDRQGAVFELGQNDLVQLVPLDPGGARSLSVAGIELKAKTGLSPFGSGYVSVEAPGKVSVSSAHPGADGSGIKARLPLAIHNNWVLLRDLGGAPDAAYVLILANGDSTAAAKQKLSDEIKARGPELFERLKADSNDEAAQPEMAGAGAGFGGFAAQNGAGADNSSQGFGAFTDNSSGFGSGGFASGGFGGQPVQPAQPTQPPTQPPSQPQQQQGFQQPPSQPQQQQGFQQQQQQGSQQQGFQQQQPQQQQADPNANLGFGAFTQQGSNPWQQGGDGQNNDGWPSQPPVQQPNNTPPEGDEGQYNPWTNPRP